MLSIVIPVFNELHWTKECLDNLKLFVDEPYEVIIIDDWSTDGTEDWIRSKNLPHVKYFKNQRNRGVTYSWNRGVLETSGDYILVINNDIKIISPNTIPILKALSDTHAFACPSFYRKNEEKVYNHNGMKDWKFSNIAGFCFMFHRSKSLFPIDDRLKIWYNDNWLCLKAKSDIGRWGLIRHYESQTLKSTADDSARKRTDYRIQQDAKTWEIILDENNRR